MAIIPAEEKVFMVSNSTNTTYSGSAALKAMQQWYTMEDVTNTVRPYKVFTALLTQSGESHSGDRAYGDTLTLGVTYLIYQNTYNEDLTIFGAPNSNVGTYFICTTVGVLPDGTGLSFDDGAPVATVLENTIGNIWFNYADVGSYYIYNENQFDTAKTTYTFTYANYYSYITAQFDDGGVMPAINITTRNVDGANVDSYLYQQPIEIRVYS